MVYRGRGNPGPRGFPRPFRARGRGRRPFPHRGQNRGGYGRGDEGLRITLRNRGRGRRNDEGYDRRSHEHERERHDDYEDYRDDFDRRSHEHERERHDDYEGYRDDFDQGSNHEFEEGGILEDDPESSHRDSRKRQHEDSVFTEEESLRITLGNSRFREGSYSDRRDSPHNSSWNDNREQEERWEDEQREEEDYSDRRRSRDGDFREGSLEENSRGRGKWDKGKRARGRGFFRPRGFDPNYRGRGRGRGDFQRGFRGRGRGKFDPNERRGRGFYKNFERGRGGRGGHSPHDRHSFDNDFDRDSHRRSVSRERRRSRSSERFSRSPDRRRSRSRSFGRGRSRSASFSRSRRSYSPGRRSFSRDRSGSRGRRSLSRRRSHSRGRRSLSRGSSPSRGRRSLSRGRLSRRRSESRGRRSRSRRRQSVSRRRRSHSSSKSYSGSRRSSSRSRSPVPIRREASRPKSMGREPRPKSLGREIGVIVSGGGRSVPIGSSPPRSMSQGRELRGGSRRRSRSSSSTSSRTGGSKSPEDLPMSEQQYEEEMYRRLKSEISSNKDPKAREECIAVHIREMAKLSPFLFRQFMARNAGNLSAMALMQPDKQEAVELVPSQAEETRPLRSILKRKGDSRSPSPKRNPSPPPPQQAKGLSNIERVIQALRKGGSKPEESKPQREKTPPAPPPSGALRQLSSYMDIDDEEEFLYGDREKPEAAEPKQESLSGPFWSAHRFEEKEEIDMFDIYEDLPHAQPSSKLHSAGKYNDGTTAAHKGNEIKIPTAFSSLEEKEKSYEQWRASVFQKPTAEKPKESEVPQSDVTTSDSAEQLSSTVENILKSIGFNFELSQRMQELARQKKEEEQDALRINQSASFLGADPDALAQNLSDVFQREEESPPSPIGFMKEIEAAKRAAREKAQKAKEAEERHVRGPRNPSIEEELLRERTRKFSGHYESSGYAKEDDKINMPKKSRKFSDTARTHSPYDPSIQDYHQRRSVPPERRSSEQDRKDLYQESESYFEDVNPPQPVGLSNLISLGTESREQGKMSYRREESDLALLKRFSDPSLPDFDRHDRNREDFEYKKTGERILIVRKKEEKTRTDSPGSENIFSRRIVLPPKEKSKVPQMKSPNSDSRKEGKKRMASPDSPRQSKYARRSPSNEDFSLERKIFPKTKSTNLGEIKVEMYRKIQEKSHSPERRAFDSKFKYQAKQEGSSKNTDIKGKPEYIKPSDSSSKSDSLKGKDTEPPKTLLKHAVKEAAKSAESKAQYLERKRQLAVLERELDALRQQHNELLRKRRRQKDGHRDPLIVENTKLQAEITAQIRSLRRGSDATASTSAAASPSSSRDKSSKTDVEDKSKSKEEPKIHYEYFDPGSHWCSTCNLVCGHMFDFFKHVESKKHQQKLDPFNRPWLVEAMQKQEKKPKPEGQVQAAPIKGLEFMMATSAFYCSLCKEYCGDLSIAETHMKSEEHHNTYKEYLSQHPYYEKRHMLERSAALSSQKRFSPVHDDDNSDDGDSDKQKSDESKKKPAAKSDSKSKTKDKDEDWKEKILGKKMYADCEEEDLKDKVKFESRDRDRDKRRYRGRSRDRSRERSDSSRDRRGGSRERRSDGRDRTDSKDRKDDRTTKEREKSEKSSTSKPDHKETVPEVKAAEPSEPGEKPVDPSGPETEQNASEESMKEESNNEETKKDPDVSMDSDTAADEPKEEAKADEGTKADGEEKRDKEAEPKGKIPIKLTGKSGIKPAAAAVPPWKMFTRPIPKSSLQKRLLAPRPQQAASASSSGIGPAIPNEEPAPLDDFLTVGVRKTVPVVSDAPPVVEQPPDPKTYRKAGDGKVEGNKERLKEMKVLGIDPSSLVPLAKPRPPPPPSQNLSLPADKSVLGASPAKPESGPEDKSDRTAGKNSKQPKAGPVKAGGDRGTEKPRTGPVILTANMGKTSFPPPPVSETLVSPYSVPPPRPVMSPLLPNPPPFMGPPTRPPMLPVPDTSLPPPGFAPPISGFAPSFPSPFMPPPPMAVPVMRPPPPLAAVPLTTPPPPTPPPPPPPPPPPLPIEPVPIPPPPPPPPKTEQSPEKDSRAKPEEDISAPSEQPAKAPMSEAPGTSEAPPTSEAGGPSTAQVDEAPPSSQAAEMPPTSPVAHAPTAEPTAEVSPKSKAEEAPLTSQVTEVALASQDVGIFPTLQTEQVPVPQVPLPVDIEVSASDSVTHTEFKPTVKVSAGPLPQSEIAVTSSQMETQSSSAMTWSVQPSAAMSVVDSVSVVPAASPSSAVEEASASSVSEPASELAGKVEPQPSVSEPEVAPSGDSAEPTSSVALAAPSRRGGTTRRGRGGRKAVPVQSMPAEESGVSEVSSNRGAAASRRRTRSQVRQQPQRQTRSRTRQQRTEEEEESVTASDEATVTEGKVASSSARESESPDGNKASSTSACVLDLTSSPADNSEGCETHTEVTSSSSDVKTTPIVQPPTADSALNLILPPEERGARQELREQTMPEDLSSYAEPQDLSTSSARKGKGRRPPEMPIDLTMRLVPPQASQPEAASLPMEIQPSQPVETQPPQPMETQPSQLMETQVPQLIETQPSPGCSITSSESSSRLECLDPQTVKDTLLSSTSALNPSASNLSELDVGGGEEAEVMEDSSSQVADSAGLGVDPEGELVDFSLAPVDFEELVDMEVDEANAAQAEVGNRVEEEAEAGGSADSTFPQNNNN